MQSALLSVGRFQFMATAPSFNMLRNTLEPRWAEQDRLTRAQAGQFIGAANPTVDLTGVLYPDAFADLNFGDAARTMMDEMAASANSGEIHYVVALTPSTLNGVNQGTWYIKSLQNERFYFGENGAKKVDFQITLRAYGDDIAGLNGVIIQ